ncbi:hypothetical protein [uncultured Gammaproteobacteria bacterium]|nr:hypothetical protein [uncultured Gammaproteobacteria bacterium]
MCVYFYFLYFLSHLCGGESSLSNLERSSAFLSHLCGGEFVFFLRNL